MYRKFLRLKNWNYSQNGFYFITIVTKNRKNYFGKISDQKIILSNTGKYIEKFWLEIPQHFNDVILDEYVIMPNHIHGIIIIDNAVEYRHACTLRKQNALIPIIIGSFKSASTRKIHSLYTEQFHWQKSYYDHIIRSEKSLNKIRKYIVNNPLKWKIDKLYSKKSL